MRNLQRTGYVFHVRGSIRVSELPCYVLIRVIVFHLSKDIRSLRLWWLVGSSHGLFGTISGPGEGV